MRRIKTLLIGLAVLVGSLLVPALALAQEADLTSSAAAISGTVYETDGITPIADAQVELIDLNGEVVELRVTGEDGRYSFASLNLGSYRLKAGRPGYVEEYSTDSRTLDGAEYVSPVGSGGQSVNFTLDLPGGISGYVYAADGVTPLDAAAVYVYDYTTQQSLGLSLTAPDGWYGIDYLAPGEYLVQAVSAGSLPEYAGGKLTPESASPILVTGGASTEGVDFALRPAAQFTGRITESDGVTPIEAAAVYAYDYASNEAVAWVETSADGSFDLTVPTGTYRLTAYQFNYETRDFNSDPTRDTAEALTISGGETRDGIEIALAGVGVVSGSVYLPDGVTPAGGVSVLIYDSPTATVHTYSVTTLANGTYSRSVIDGTYYFKATSLSYEDIYYQQKLTLSVANAVSVPPNAQTSNITMIFLDPALAADTDGTVDLQGHGAKPSPRWSVPLRVLITPDGTSSPIYGATLNTDNSGVFTVTGVPPGTYRIWVKHSHTLATAVTASLATGDNAVTIGVLKEGDANDSNTVTIADFSILAGTFGKASGESGYDGRADFNNDGGITIADFSLLAANFSQTGAAP